jgi:hypothetical protein
MDQVVQVPLYQDRVSQQFQRLVVVTVLAELIISQAAQADLVVVVVIMVVLILRLVVQVLLVKVIRAAAVVLAVVVVVVGEPVVPAVERLVVLDVPGHTTHLHMPAVVLAQITEQQQYRRVVAV